MSVATFFFIVTFFVFFLRMFMPLELLSNCEPSPLFNETARDVLDRLVLLRPKNLRDFYDDER